MSGFTKLIRFDEKGNKNPPRDSLINFKIKSNFQALGGINKLQSLN